MKRLGTAHYKEKNQLVTSKSESDSGAVVSKSEYVTDSKINDVYLNMTSDRTCYSIGDEVTIQCLVMNLGNSNVAGLDIEFAFDESLTLDSYTGGSNSLSSRIWSISNLTVGESESIQLKFTVTKIPQDSLSTVSASVVKSDTRLEPSKTHFAYTIFNLFNSDCKIVKGNICVRDVSTGEFFALAIDSSEGAWTWVLKPVDEL